MVKYILLMVPILVLSACISNDEGPREPEAMRTAPEWLVTPPHEQGFYYGIGGDKDLTEAKQKSIVDISFQFCACVEAAFVTSRTEQNGNETGAIATLNNQVARQTVMGAKFFDQYKDADGTYWVLSRVNTDCLLDVTEGLVLSYALETGEETGLERTFLDRVLDRVERTITDPSHSGPAASRSLRGGAFTPPVRTITVDGNADDWAGVWDFYRDGSDDFKPGVPAGTKLCDIQTVHFAVDTDYLYMMVRTGDRPINTQDFFYAFNWETPEGVFYIDLFAPYTGASRVESWTRKGHYIDPRRVTDAISSRTRVRTGEVLEVAIPIERFLSLPEMQPVSKFLILVRTKRPVIDLDDMTRYEFTIPVEKLGLDM